MLMLIGQVAAGDGVGIAGDLARVLRVRRPGYGVLRLAAAARRHGADGTDGDGEPLAHT
jgi:hypothetical protein